MANNYRVKVHIEIVECTDAVTATPSSAGGSVFETSMSAEQAQSIDACEQLLLQTNYAALREAFATHLSAMSRRYALQAGGTLAECEVKPYRVDGEVGRITFDTYWVPQTGAATDDTAQSLFPVLHAQEWYRTTGFKELALRHGTVDESFRKTGDWLNRVRHQEEATPSRTLRDNAVAEGQQIKAYLEQRATEILQQHDFTPAGAPTEATANRSQQPLVALPPEQVTPAIQSCAPASEWVSEMTANPVPYEDPAHSTHVSLDDVGVKRQKATRKEAEAPTPEHKYVHHTIAHIAHAGASYLISGHGVAPVLRLVLAFLLHNNLLRYNLIFFVDGQRTLYATILKAFAWFKPLQPILDWYHLEERCKQQLSLALKGRDIRNAVLDQLCPCLWHGCVDRALAVLQAIEPTDIKNPEALTDLQGYLERNRPYLPCYAVRKCLGLRNSSNQGEKANDLLVSDRQKHNGMSWSRAGSVTLAAITAVVHNQEHKQWFQTRTLAFRLAA
jgi:hypothetical protein